MKFATANIFKGMPLEDARAGLHAVLAEKPDVVALQEWGPNRSSILRDLKGYHHARSPKGGGPVLYSDRFGLLRTNSRTLARDSFIGHLVGRKSTLPESIAAEFIFTDDATGHGLAVINFHLTAEVQAGGKYRTDKAHAPRVKRHKREVAALERIVRKHQAKGRRVLMLGDTNYDSLRIKGLVSCWVGQPMPGTLGKRTVDQIYAEQSSTRTRTVVTGSDHRAVVAQY